MHQHGAPSEFPRGLQPSRAASSSCLIAAILTAILYVLVASMIWWSLMASPRNPPISEITATLSPDVPQKKVAPRPPPFLAHLIRPHAQTVAPPVFTVASGAPLMPAPLPALEVKSSPMPGGSSGSSMAGQSASANGVSGSGTAVAGCLDPVWMRAVSERVRQFFYYPPAALGSRTTGVVVVHFVVRRDGRLGTVDVGRSSGNDILDEAAPRIVRLADPLPPIPDRMHTDRVDGELPINFGVRSFNGAPTISHCGN
jgi:TonB family protein